MRGAQTFVLILISGNIQRVVIDVKMCPIAASCIPPSAIGSVEEMQGMILPEFSAFPEKA
jgi:hypothetical protein